MAHSNDAPALGPRLQQIRKDRRLTLDQLAGKSQVSRSMLSQIERGAANPTFATLWQLTRALDIDFAELLGMSSNSGGATAVEVIEAHFTPEIGTQDGACRLRILSPASRVGDVEWYELLIAPGGALVSEPHAKGATEHLTVLEGQFSIVSGEGSATVEPGATVRYAADAPHEIRNIGPVPARALLVVLSG